MAQGLRQAGHRLCLPRRAERCDERLHRPPGRRPVVRRLPGLRAGGCELGLLAQRPCQARVREFALTGQQRLVDRVRESAWRNLKLAVACTGSSTPCSTAARSASANTSSSTGTPPRAALNETSRPAAAAIRSAAFPVRPDGRSWPAAGRASPGEERTRRVPRRSAAHRRRTGCPPSARRSRRDLLRQRVAAAPGDQRQTASRGSGAELHRAYGAPADEAGGKPLQRVPRPHLVAAVAGDEEDPPVRPPSGRGRRRSRGSTRPPNAGPRARGQRRRAHRAAPARRASPRRAAAESLRALRDCAASSRVSPVEARQFVQRVPEGTELR